jgi:hypothetical protein
MREELVKKNLGSCITVIGGDRMGDALIDASEGLALICY